MESIKREGEEGSQEGNKKWNQEKGRGKGGVGKGIKNGIKKKGGGRGESGKESKMESGKREGMMGRKGVCQKTWQSQDNMTSFSRFDVQLRTRKSEITKYIFFSRAKTLIIFVTKL